MRFTEQVGQQAMTIREQVFQHPFVIRLGDGTLPLVAFQYYMCQDYVFLVEYCRVLALAVAKARDLDTMERFAVLLQSTLTTEMALHRDCAAQCGTSLAVLEATQAAPSTRSYTQHLLSTAYAGSLPEITAALLPCMWDYSEIGQRLAARGLPVSQPLYSAWIQTYAAPEFGALAQWLRHLLDDLAHQASPAARTHLAQLFVESCRYEYLFWDMAYRQETWPI
ncbi:MAG: thiaminase II [Candidatus Tectimicrobiota bacterium]